MARMTSVVELRVLAEDRMRAKDDDGLLALVPQLREDEQWGHWWAPGCAIAARRLGRAQEGRRYLQEALDAGFFQPEIFDDAIEQAFGDEPDWPQLRSAFTANVPPAPLELLTWPTLTPALPLELFRMKPEREEQLRPLLPDLSGSSWPRALTLVHWVSSRWTHANDHVEADQDALDVLHYVDHDGKRFACVEFSIVLCHALNAAGIPSRRLALRQRDYHAGLSKGHVASEAWIDDLGKWVVLDGQHGGYWTFGAEPLSALELQEALAAGRRPDLLKIDGPMRTEKAGFWFSYFWHVVTTGATLARPPYAPHFQRHMRTGQLLVRDPAGVYPDLSEIGVTMDARDGAAAMRFTVRHPYVTGYAVRCADQRWTLDVADPVWVLPAAGGVHTATVSVRTPHSELRPQELSFRIAPE